MSSKVRQNFDDECEEAINKQINMELYASYFYMSMAYYFDRDSVALPGMHKYFKHSSDEEREHAMKLMKYLNKRGGKIVLEDIKKPNLNDEFEASYAMDKALELEKEVNASLLKLHAIASANNDPHLCDFLETEFLDEQVESMKEIADLSTNLDRCGGSGLGMYLFDKDLLERKD